MAATALPTIGVEPELVDGTGFPSKLYLLVVPDLRGPGQDGHVVVDVEVDFEMTGSAETLRALLCLPDSDQAERRAQRLQAEHGLTGRPVQMKFQDACDTARKKGLRLVVLERDFRTTAVFFVD